MEYIVLWPSLNRYKTQPADRTHYSPLYEWPAGGKKNELKEPRNILPFYRKISNLKRIFKL